MTAPYSNGPGPYVSPVQDPRQLAVPGRSRGKALGAACRGFGITGLVVFALVILGTLVYVLIPRGEHGLDLAPIAFDDSYTYRGADESVISNTDAGVPIHLGTSPRYHAK